MAKKIDLSTVAPERAAFLLRCREAKKREYARRKEELLQRHQAWRDANPEKAKAGTLAWRAENQERVAENKRAWYEANRDLQLQRSAVRDAELVDSVVKSRYCAGTRLQSKDIPDALVPLIRNSILVKRAIKEQKRELRRADD